LLNEFLEASANFSAGAVDAFLSNFAFGLGRHSFDDVAFQRGQTVGDAASIFAGAAEAIQGGAGSAGGTVLDATAVGAVVGVPVQIVSGAMIIHGGAASGLGFVNLMEANRKGGGKSGRKINQKREESLKRQLEEAKSRLASAKTKDERKEIVRQMVHLRKQLKASETHWRR
jgi:hypothetical protein